MGKQSLSVCILLKNEDGYLSGTLERIREIADEIIIVNSPPAPLFLREGSKKSSSLLSTAVPSLEVPSLSERGDLGVRAKKPVRFWQNQA